MKLIKNVIHFFFYSFKHFDTIYTVELRTVPERAI